MTLKNHSPLLEEREVEEEEEVNRKEEEEESDNSEEDGDDDEETEKSRLYVVPNSKPKSKDAEVENSDDDSESDEHNLIEKEEEVNKPKHTSVPAKRPANIATAPKGQVEAEKSKKRRKKNNDANAGEESEKKPARVWTEEGEIVLLKGMANYYIKKGKRPNSDLNGFYEFIKGSINNDVSKDQLANKIRHARLRYLQNEAKEKSGEVVSFSKPYFEKCYELSKTIWGGEKQRQKNGKRKQGKDDEGETTGADGVTNGKSKSKKLKTGHRLKATVEKEEEGFGMKDLIKFKEQMIKPPPGLESFLNRVAFQLIGPSRRKAFETKWKDLQVEETELFLKRIDLVREYSSMVFEALKCSPTS